VTGLTECRHGMLTFRSRVPVWLILITHVGGIKQMWVFTFEKLTLELLVVTLWIAC